MARLLTQAQFARKVKYSRARITQLVKQGVIILKNGKVDPAQAQSSIAANIDRSRRIKSEAKIQAGKSPQLDLLPNGFNTDRKNGIDSEGFNIDPTKLPPSLTEARRDHELLKMKLTETNLKVRRSQLIPKNESVKWLVGLGAATKLAFLNLPRRMAGVLKTLTDEKEIEILLRSEIEKIIHELLEKPLGAKHKRSRRKNPKRSLGNHLEATG